MATNHRELTYLCNIPTRASESSCPCRKNTQTPYTFLDSTPGHAFFYYPEYTLKGASTMFWNNTINIYKYSEYFGAIFHEKFPCNLSKVADTWNKLLSKDNTQK